MHVLLLDNFSLLKQALSLNGIIIKSTIKKIIQIKYLVQNITTKWNFFKNSNDFGYIL